MERQQSLGWQIAVLAKRMTDDLDAVLKCHGLSIIVWPALYLLWEEEGVNHIELSKRCWTLQSTTSIALENLEEIGLIDRKPDPQYPQVKLIFLTDRGRFMRDSLLRAEQKIIDRTLAALDEPDKNELFELIRSLNQHDLT